MTTDGNIVKLARKIQEKNEAVLDIIQIIGKSNHPNAGKLDENLYNECSVSESAEATAWHYLAHPERWALLFGHKIYHKSSEMYKWAKENDPKQIIEWKG